MSFLHLIFVLRLLLTFFSLLLFHDFFSQNFAKLRNPMEGDPGFFLDDWEEKRNPKISYSKNRLISNGESTVNAVVDFSNPLVKISKYIFGNKQIFLLEKFSPIFDRFFMVFFGFMRSPVVPDEPPINIKKIIF